MLLDIIGCRVLVYQQYLRLRRVFQQHSNPKIKPRTLTVRWQSRTASRPGCRYDVLEDGRVDVFVASTPVCMLLASPKHSHAQTCINA